MVNNTFASHVTNGLSSSARMRAVVDLKPRLLTFPWIASVPPAGVVKTELCERPRDFLFVNAFVLALGC